jgi:ketosteroid isomerase-like protein
MEPELKRAAEDFLAALDNTDVATLAATYTPDFRNIWLSADGEMAELTGTQILFILKASADAPHSLPVSGTVIHHAEMAGDSGYVLVTRNKDLGNGWEPAFYTLIWRKIGGKWLLSREFVHQKTFPCLKP